MKSKIFFNYAFLFSRIFRKLVFYYHDYENVIEHLVWETITTEIPELKDYLEEIK